MNYDAFHETLHLLGLSDRYGTETINGKVYSKQGDEGFNEDVMGRRGSFRIGETHYRDYVTYFQTHNYKSGYLRQGWI